MTVTEQPTRAQSPPRENVLRTAPFSLRADESTEDGDGLTLDGYAAVFNRETIIDSWEGRFREKISPGAMKRSFREMRPKIQYDHGRHPLIGSIPVATPLDGYPREESHPDFAPDGGAHVLARLADNWLVEPLRDAIASRAIDGMSFRFTVLDDWWFDADGKRIRDEEKLMEALRRTWYEDVPDDELLLRDLRQLKVPEMGPVAWPAYGDTSVQVRSETVVIDMGHLDDPEQRKTLARAVFMADAAERMKDESQPDTDDESAAGDDTEEVAEQRTTDDESADGHSATEDDSQQTTGDREVPAGEHDTPAQPPEPAPVRYGAPADWYLPASGEPDSLAI